MRASGKALVQRRDRLDLFLAAQHAALQLEIVEAVARVRGLGEAHDRLRRQRRLVAKAQPCVVGAGLAGIRKVGLGAVADEEQVAQHLHRVALLALAEQLRDGHAQMLSEQIEQRRLDRGHRMDRRAQVERLLSAPPAVAIGEGVMQPLQQRTVAADRLADDEGRCILERLADLLAAGHFADAGSSRVVGGDHQVAREERAVRAAQVEQHAVAPRNRDDAQCFDRRRVAHRRR